MPIILTPFTQEDLCHGASWSVPNDDLLATHIAMVAIGQSRHVARILAGANLAPPSTRATSAKAAVGMLTVAGDDPSHRDGWMFQVMSWIAANRGYSSGLIRAPHMILAHKGFDGLHIEVDQGAGSLIAATIFEDKATIHPRSTIREDVWPEFKGFENGENDNVLTAEVVALLGLRPDIDADKIIENILWQKKLRYRISITIGETHNSDAGRKRLFDGYSDVVPGVVARRRAETFYVPELREWLNCLAAKAIHFVHSFEATNV